MSKELKMRVHTSMDGVGVNHFQSITQISYHHSAFAYQALRSAHAANHPARAGAQYFSGFVYALPTLSWWRPVWGVHCSCHRCNESHAR